MILASFITSEGSPALGRGKESCRRFAAKTSYLPTPRRASNTAGVQWTARLRQMRIRVGRAPTLNRIEAGKRTNSHRAATARSFV